MFGQKQVEPRSKYGQLNFEPPFWTQVHLPKLNYEPTQTRWWERNLFQTRPDGLYIRYYFLRFQLIVSREDMTEFESTIKCERSFPLGFQNVLETPLISLYIWS